MFADNEIWYAGSKSSKRQRRPTALDVVERRAAIAQKTRESRYSLLEIKNLVGNAKAYEVDADIPRMYHQTLGHGLRDFIAAGEENELRGLTAHPDTDPEDRKPAVCFGPPVERDTLPERTLVLDLM